MRAIMCVVGFITAFGVSGCGGADDSDAARLQYVVDYLPTGSPTYPNGTVMVSPVAPASSIGTAPIASVQVTIYGHAPQVLTQINFERKDDGIGRFVFGVPADFVSGAFTCDPGQHPSQVEVVDVNGFSSSRALDLCPGTPSEVSVSSS